MASIKDTIRHAWDVFTRSPGEASSAFSGGGSWGSSRPDRTRFQSGGEKSIIGGIYTRMGIDAAAVSIQHVRNDADGRYAETMNSGLNNCLTVEANLDQSATHFRQDMVMSMFDKGVIALVPVETSVNVNTTGSYDIKELRVGHILEWFPDKVRVSVYNKLTGKRQEIILPKSVVAIVENPMYLVMNEPNSILQRLIRKLGLLDAVDEASSSGKLDLIIQLPYTIKSEVRRQQAQQRTKDIEMQLKSGQYGIAYADASEKITQLNRPVENQLLVQVEYLTDMLYAQLGLSAKVFNGTADEAEMLNYRSRTLKPILTAFAEAMQRSFLTKTARTQGQAIMFYFDSFSFMSMKEFGDFGDKMTRNKIMTTNELRVPMGLKPHPDPSADKLENPNMPTEKAVPTEAASPPEPNPGKDQNDSEA